MPDADAHARAADAGARRSGADPAFREAEDRSPGLAADYLDAFGTTGRVRFKRAYAILCAVILATLLITPLSTAVGYVAGAGSGVSVPAWLAPAIILVTGVFVTVLHIRRFRDARRSALWALPVLAPLGLGLMAFAGEVTGSAERWDKRVAVTQEVSALSPTRRAQRTSEASEARGLIRGAARQIEARRLREALTEPPEAGGVPVVEAGAAGRAAKAVLNRPRRERGQRSGAGSGQGAGPAAADSAAAATDGGVAGTGPAESAGAPPRRAGGAIRPFTEDEIALLVRHFHRSALPPPYPRTEIPSQRGYAVENASSAFMSAWRPLALLMFVYSLLWPARLPTGGGRIKDRLAALRAEGAVPAR